MQVVKLTAPSLPCLPPFTTVRNLLLDTNNFTGLLPSLEGLPQLETLSLQAYDEYSDSVECVAIDLAHLTTLQHLRIRGFALPDITVGAACEVHAVWDSLDERQASTGVDSWLQSDVWEALGAQLASLCVRCPRSLSSAGVQGLQELLNVAPDLEHFKMVVPLIGTSKELFIVSANGFAKACNVAIEATLACWLKLDEIALSWQNLSSRTKGVLSLEIPYVTEFAQSVKGFSMQFDKVKGPVLVELTKAFMALGRRVTTTQKSQGGVCVVHTLQGQKEMQEFDRLMGCLCSACMDCLNKNGKLPVDSKPPFPEW